MYETLSKVKLILTFYLFCALLRKSKHSIHPETVKNSFYFLNNKVLKINIVIIELLIFNIGYVHIKVIAGAKTLLYRNVPNKNLNFIFVSCNQTFYSHTSC